MRRAVHRLRRRLGLPPLSGRSWLLAILVFVALVVGATLLGELFTKFGGYGPRYYEPKDFQREEPPSKKQ